MTQFSASHHAPAQAYTEFFTLLCCGALQLPAGQLDKFQLPQLYSLFIAHYQCPALSYQVFRRNLFNSPVNHTLSSLGYRIVIVAKHPDLDRQCYGVEKLAIKHEQLGGDQLE